MGKLSGFSPHLEAELRSGTARGGEHPRSLENDARLACRPGALIILLKG
jgi:hypothetical protein